MQNTITSDFDAREPGLRAFLSSAAGWSDFAASLLAALHRYDRLTPSQVAAVRSMQAKAAAREAQRAAPAAVVDLAPIRAMFETAVAKGFKRPTYRAEGLMLSLAPATGRNPNAIYVKDLASDAYMGKVAGTAYTGAPAALAPLAVIARDPSGAAVRHGHRTGSCAICGRRLDNAESVERGIGPICFSRYF